MKITIYKIKLKLINQIKLNIYENKSTINCIYNNVLFYFKFWANPKSNTFR